MEDGEPFSDESSDVIKEVDNKRSSVGSTESIVLEPSCQSKGDNETAVFTDGVRVGLGDLLGTGGKGYLGRNWASVWELGDETSVGKSCGLNLVIRDDDEERTSLLSRSFKLAGNSLRWAGLDGAES